MVSVGLQEVLVGEQRTKVHGLMRTSRLSINLTSAQTINYADKVTCNALISLDSSVKLLEGTCIQFKMKFSAVNSKQAHSGQLFAFEEYQCEAEASPEKISIGMNIFVYITNSYMDVSN
jgi:hypothetical protein